MLVVPPTYGSRSPCTSGAPSVWCTNQVLYTSNFSSIDTCTPVLYCCNVGGCTDQSYAEWLALNQGNFSFYTGWAFAEPRIIGSDRDEPDSHFGRQRLNMIANLV